MIGFGFTTPLVLTALLALPLIWFLLKLTPPRPAHEVFPPLRILASLLQRHETPAQSPWWLTLLRLLLASAVILAMAGPLLNPRRDHLSTRGPLLLVIDNSWAAAPDWRERVAAGEALIAEAESRNLPVSLILTADDSNDATPQGADVARARLEAAAARPVPAPRDRLARLLANAFQAQAPGSAVYMTDGVTLAGKGLAEDRTLATLSALAPDRLTLIRSKDDSTLAITGVRNAVEGVEVTASRADSFGSADYPLSAFDRQQRAIGTDVLHFAAGAAVGHGLIRAPLELRNEYASIAIGIAPNAGSTYLLDDGAKRRRVGIIGGDSAESARPLLSSVYYIRRALSPFADISQSNSNDPGMALTGMLALKPSALVLTDIAKLPGGPGRALLDWVRSGGTLIRFASPELAASEGDDPFATVPLRRGERSFGGVLSWSEPQPLAAYPDIGAFADLPRADDVHVRRQILAEPSPDLAQHTLASLADGTPLVTSRKLGAGEIVLFHVSGEPGWSDLPLSGHFVEMLRRLVQLSRSTIGQTGANGKPEPLPPYRLLSAEGALTTVFGSAKPLNPATDLGGIADTTHPPGLYGGEDGYVARNLLPVGTELRPIPAAVDGRAVDSRPLTIEQPRDLVPLVIGLALVLVMLDGLAVLWLNGGLRLRRAATAALLPLALLTLFAWPSGPLRADDGKPGDETLLKRLDTTHLAYVVTGEEAVDAISRQGLAGLTEFLAYRTALEPGQPEGVDIARDELSVFPLIYWPVSATARMPDAAAIGRIGAYMRAGGTVLFDTRDQSEHAFGDTAVTPNGERLRTILADLDIPPLEPVPARHVLTRSFYLMTQFPGRYAESPLWVEAGQGGNRSSDATPVSPDGVSPILITANDLAGAWAVDDTGNPILPTIPPDENQREYAYRAGVNIMMYMLTGNYKGDQVHVPALLERLGN